MLWRHPVPELRAHVERDQLTLETPWLRAEIALTDESRAWATERALELDGGWIAPEGMLSTFVQPFRDLAFWIERAVPPSAPAMAEESHPLLRFARAPSPDAYDAHAVLSVMRWCGWTNDELTDASAALARSAKETGRDGLPLLLRQELEVTRACDGAIRPACDAFPSARAAVERFLAQEQGHDRLLEKSLAEVPGVAEPVPSLASLLAHLAALARTDFLGLAGVIDLLEGLDDVWSHVPETPEGARTHAAINSREKHARVADALVATQPVSSREAALRALEARRRGESLVASANRELVAGLELVRARTARTGS